MYISLKCQLPPRLLADILDTYYVFDVHVFCVRLKFQNAYATGCSLDVQYYHWPTKLLTKGHSTTLKRSSAIKGAWPVTILTPRVVNQPSKCKHLTNNLRLCYYRY